MLDAYTLVVLLFLPGLTPNDPLVQLERPGLTRGECYQQAHDWRQYSEDVEPGSVKGWTLCEQR